jgi:hypothetical protein
MYKLRPFRLDDVQTWSIGEGGDRVLMAIASNEHFGGRGADGIIILAMAHNPAELLPRLNASAYAISEKRDRRKNLAGIILRKDYDAMTPEQQAVRNSLWPNHSFVILDVSMADVHSLRLVDMSEVTWLTMSDPRNNRDQAQPFTSPS